MFDRIFISWRQRRVVWLPLLVCLTLLALPSSPHPIATAAAHAWSTQGPLGALVHALLIDSNDPQTLFIGTSKGLFTSRDGGGTWLPMQTGIPATPIWSLAADFASTTLYAATSQGVFKSSDNGSTWAIASTGITNTQVLAVALRSSDPTTIYAATPAGLFQSSDAAANWTILATTPTNITSLALDANNPQRLAVGTESGRLFYSASAGLRWLMGDRNFGPNGLTTIAYDPVITTTLYAGTASNGLFVSTTGGASWLPVGTASVTNVASLLLLPGSSAARIYVGGFGGVALSTDSAQTWGAVGAGLPEVMISTLASNGADLYAGTVGGGVATLPQRTTNWQLINQGLNQVQVNAIQYLPSTSTLLAATDSGLFRSTDDGASWQPTTHGLTGTLDLRSFTQPPGGTIFLGTNGSGVFASVDDGVTWQPSSVGITNPQIISLVYATSITTTLYAGTFGGGVFISEDGGTRWRATNRGLTDLQLNALAVDPTNPTTLYAGTGVGTIFRSSDGGTNWTPYSEGLTVAGIFALTVDPQGTLYAGTFGAGVIERTRTATAWQPSQTGLAGSTVFALQIDPNDPDHIYAATDGEGVFYRARCCTDWTPINTGLQSTVVRSLAFADPALYAGTVRGVYSTENLLLTPIVNAPAAANAGEAFHATVHILTSDGSLHTAYNGTVTLALAAGSGDANAVLAGTLTSPIISGTASFTDLRIAKAGSGYQLQATIDGLLPSVSTPFNVLSTTPTTTTTEQEPNDLLDAANPLVFDSAAESSRSGTIADETDADWYMIYAPAGTTISAHLTNLPADYDLALLSNPASNPLAGANLGNLADTSAVGTDGSVDGLGRAAAIDQIERLGEINASESLIDLSANSDTHDEQITTRVTAAGFYYLFVYSGDGAFDATQPYQLAVALQGGSADTLDLAVKPIATLVMTPDATIETLFIYNRGRMAANYPNEQSQLTSLDSLLTPGSALMDSSKGALLGLSNGTLYPRDQTHLNNLYAQWDRNPTSVEAANLVAAQLYAIIEATISDYYPNVANLVMVGDDTTIPFYRVPDETALGNEAEYAGQLRELGVIKEGTPLVTSLAGGFFQTDNYYADLSPTPWRGRYLYLPDLGIGRLVETPSDILAYLTAYPTGDPYTVRANDTTPGKAGAAFVSGYDFVSDEAAAIADQLATYGFAPQNTLTDTLGINPTVNLLNSNTWALDQFTTLWLSGQLPKLTSTYTGLGTRYQLMSLNGHFNHYNLLPADLATSFPAARILTPTSTLPTQPFFKPGNSASLIYTIGCQSGLSAPDSAFQPQATAYQADFAAAVLRQGGNLIGNTGFGYGDLSQIGYSERLALLFTQAIGRDARVGGSYAGASVGESLALAKQAYLASAGPGGFSIFDEKVLGSMTFYGLPFIRVQVPIPSDAPFHVPAQPIPTDVVNGLPSNQGIFTRLITLTNTFSQATTSSGAIPTVTASVEDSFRPGVQTIITGTARMAPGRPVLPTLAYDITLRSNPAQPGTAIPEPRGVRMRQATTLTEVVGYDPLVTTIFTETERSQADTLMANSLWQEWLPDVPYTFQRTEVVSDGAKVAHDQLIVTPAQFSASSAQVGTLRRFTQMVLEVSYLDPETSAPAAADCTNCTPALSNLATLKCYLIPKTRCPMPLAMLQGNEENYLIGATVVSQPSLTIREVSATYSTDGIHWQRAILLPAGNNRYQGTASAPANSTRIDIYYEAIDSAGDAVMRSDRTNFKRLSDIYLPLVMR